MIGCRGPGLAWGAWVMPGTWAVNPRRGVCLRWEMRGHDAFEVGPREHPVGNWKDG